MGKDALAWRWLSRHRSSDTRAAGQAVVVTKHNRWQQGGTSAKGEPIKARAAGKVLGARNQAEGACHSVPGGESHGTVEQGRRQ
jgi:hypothetical protein